jgi:hypothetical protein
MNAFRSFWKRTLASPRALSVVIWLIAALAVIDAFSPDPHHSASRSWGLPPSTNWLFAPGDLLAASCFAHCGVRGLRGRWPDPRVFYFGLGLGFLARGGSGPNEPGIYMSYRLIVGLGLIANGFLASRLSRRKAAEAAA